MITEKTYGQACPVYPGEYSPLPEVEASWNEFKKQRGEVLITPQVNIDEFKDHFRVSMVIPGVRREEFIVAMSEHTLTVAVVHRDRETEFSRSQKQPLHEFDCKCFERIIKLPDNTSTEFVSAQYRNGILYFYIPKNGKPSTIKDMPVVVY